jgi:hypothetical protein
MSKQWKAMTRGGHDYRITARNPESDFPIRGEVDDSGIVVHVQWNEDGVHVQWNEDGVHVQWTEDGGAASDGEHPYDLIPIEPEAPSPANAKVDLALAAYAYRAAVVEFQRYEDQKDNLARVLLDSFAESEKTEVVVKIKGENYFFWTQNAKVFFRKIEVL